MFKHDVSFRHSDSYVQKQMRLKVVITVSHRIARTFQRDILLAFIITRTFYCTRCNHIVVTIHHLIGLGAFCHSIKQVAPRVIKRGHTKGVYNRIVITIATDFTFFFLSFFFFSFLLHPCIYFRCGRCAKTAAKREFINRGNMNSSFPILAYELLQNIANIVFDVCVDNRYDIYIVRENLRTKCREFV